MAESLEQMNFGGEDTDIQNLEEDTDMQNSGGEDTDKQSASSSNGAIKKENAENDVSEVKEGSDPSKYVRLRVLGSSESFGIHFRLKYTTALFKLKKAYSNHVGVHPDNLRFLYDGRRIADEETPKQLDMHDEDLIEVYLEQIGGN